MATRKKDPAKKARKPAPQPKRGTKKVAKAQAKKPAAKRQAKVATLRAQARERLVETVGQQQVDRAWDALTAPPKPRGWARFRSAITGLFVTLGFAKKHPDTTVRETR